ncbi:MAG: hypothetical protein EOP84_10335 [Verrucomicrobiaceae bacterium]|nr:MAG: hypothetical protein EOP84_10335 [Verrucomicrobiaceae bacterium]
MKRKAVWVLAVVALAACGFLTLRALGMCGEVVTSSEIVAEGSRPILKVKLSNHSLRSVLVDVTPGTLFGIIYVLMEDGSYKRFVTDEFDQKLLFDKGVAKRMTRNKSRFRWRGIDAHRHLRKIVAHSVKAPGLFRMERATSRIVSGGKSVPFWKARFFRNGEAIGNYPILFPTSVPGLNGL